jgi:PilZ domain
MLLETLSHEAESSSSGRPVERRAVARHRCDQDIVYYAPLTRQRRWARVRNISVHGIGLLVGIPMEPGTDLTLETRSRDPGLPLTLVARVVHCTKQEEGSWLVGCRFRTRPTDEDVRALLRGYYPGMKVPQ